MTEIQQALLTLLKELDEICRKYNIEYYLAGGSMIGAIRHGGFLPWDDDMDIHMTPENAHRFFDAVEKENLPGRKVVVGSNKMVTSMLHWRYQNTESTCYLRSLVGTELPKGQFIDIMIVYPFPSNPVKGEKCLENLALYTELRFNDGIIKSMHSQRTLKRYRRYKILQKIFGRKRVLDYLEKKTFRIQKEEPELTFIRTPAPSPVIPNALWGKPRYIPFEDTAFPVAERAEQLLRLAYGPAWFEVPQYTEQEHHVFVVDIDTPYSVYDKDIDKRFPTADFVDHQIRKKEMWFKMLKDRNISMPQIRKLQGIATSLAIENLIQENNIDLKTMVAQNRKEELQQLFAPYFERIHSVPFQYYTVYVDIPDEYLYAALYFSCFDGTYGMAQKILTMRREIINRPIIPELQRLCDLCDATDSLLTALYGDLDMQAARSIVDEWLDKEPTALYFQRADLYLRLNSPGTEPDAELLRRCGRYLEQYADDGELLKYRGDLLLRLGQREEGERCYQKALCSLRNGFCIRAIKEYFAAKNLEAVG